MTLAILIASLVADLALGMAAMKMSKATQATQAANAQTQAQLVALLTRNTDRLDNHEIRIVVLEHKVAA